MSKTDKELDLEILASQLAYAQDAVKELQEKLEQAKKEQEPWEPKPGQFIMRVDGDISTSDYGHFVDSVPFGMVFQTRESARHTEPFFRFYHRLCQLAIELNPSGKVGGRFGVYYHEDDKVWMTHFYNNPTLESVFETREAVKKAAYILNHDGWRLPK